jgi:hypothetical protein
MSNPRNPYIKIPPYAGLEEDNLHQWYCTACSQLSPIETLHNGLDNGLELSGFAGYYGGFTDQYEPDSQEQHDTYNKAYFCHKCCVKLFKTFPALARNVGINKFWGHHPCDADEPCCDYAWKLQSDPTKVYTKTIFTSARDEDNQLYWKEEVQ